LQLRLERAWAPGFLAPGATATNLLRFALLVPTAIIVVAASANVLSWQAMGMDLQIPLLATERWLAGGQPYDSSAFTATEGLGLPFLYPPFVLPFLAPLVALPRDLVLVGAVILCAGTVVWAMRRLSMPWSWATASLVWAPVLLAVWGANIQTLTFAAFCALFFRPVRGVADLRPVPVDLSKPAEGERRLGLKGAAVMAVKVAQFQSLAYLSLRRPWAALFGVGALGTVILLTIPITGIAIWGEWIEQIRLAADPAWGYGGLGIARVAPPLIAAVVLIGSLLCLLLVPRRDPGPGVGLLTVLGATSLHAYGVLFLVPAGLRIRREVFIVAILLTGSILTSWMWLGILLVGTTYIASFRFGRLREG
jgi:hypothetical protein